MSKKNKNKNIWDLTAEEQQRKADEMYELEMAELNGDFSSDNDYEDGIFSLTQNSKGKKKKKKKYEDYDVDDSYDDTSVNYGNNSIPYSEFLKMHQNDKTEDVKEVTYNNQTRVIKYIINTVLNRVVVDDEIAPTSFSIDIGKEQDIFGNFNLETIQELVSYMLDYVVSLKHPSAIFKCDEFMSDDWNFAKVKEEDYDINSFKFMQYEDYIFCYALDEESFESFIDMLDDSEYTEMELLKITTALAYASGTMHQAFFIEDESYVDKFYNSDINNKKDFHDLFCEHEDTLVNDDKVPEEESIDPTITKNLQTYVRKMISTITDSNLYGEYDDDDYEEDEEEDQTEEDESAVTSVEEDDEDYTSDTAEIAKEAADKITSVASDLFTDDMSPIDILSEALNSSAIKDTKPEQTVSKPVKEEKEFNPSLPPVVKKEEKKDEDNWDDFVIPVIRKNGDN